MSDMSGDGMVEGSIPGLLSGFFSSPQQMATIGNQGVSTGAGFPPVTPATGTPESSSPMPQRPRVGVSPGGRDLSLNPGFNTPSQPAQQPQGAAPLSSLIGRMGNPYLSMMLMQIGAGMAGAPNFGAGVSRGLGNAAPTMGKMAEFSYMMPQLQAQDQVLQQSGATDAQRRAAFFSSLTGKGNYGEGLMGQTNQIRQLPYTDQFGRSRNANVSIGGGVPTDFSSGLPMWAHRLNVPGFDADAARRKMDPNSGRPAIQIGGKWYYYAQKDGSPTQNPELVPGQ